ncbi:MAG TPA: hypothetical protein DCE42_05220 [Myxococcales bacterium]|nr:hypothetical protein [Deltaproteobacteria bacterium]MBK07352.1 hypothetical protein [Deltaproteobacteria bacterium]MBU53523.1 hypothetical protein [Deltaproteobacteria bacterium]HAA54132.1 hypothetical protein [Myxococcales bacterium]|tara:strand:- start:6722 stop:7732 length:1011 start_codon:yes stop_codon:yes gene_type:complete
MSFSFPKSFFEVWNHLIDSIKSQTIFTNDGGLKAQYTFFNTQPELRNPPNKKRFPGVILTTRRPQESSGWRVQESVKCLVDVTAEAPYLDGFGAISPHLSDGQTLILKRGFSVGGVYNEESLTVHFQTSDFADIINPTPAEVAAVIDATAGVSASVVSGGVVRVIHDEVGSSSTLRVIGGTASELLATFPVYEVIGRDAGKEQQVRRPASHYDFPFQIATLTKRFDNHSALKMFVEGLFRVEQSPSERGLQISTRTFEVTRGEPVDDPLIERGEFATTYPFTLRRVPIAWDVEAFEGDNYNGGNYDGTGINPRKQTPVVVTFEINVEAKGPEEPLL